MDKLDSKHLQNWQKIADFINFPEEQEQQDLFRRLAVSVLQEFNNLADYIWKTPNLLEHERSVEKEKLRAYFPVTGDPKRDELGERLRKARWGHESHKLFVSFPNWMATANLFLTLAQFESYCLRLVRLIEGRSNLALADAQGRGTSKIFAFLQASGIDIFTRVYCREMQVSLRVRNCLIHAEGLLELDKDEKSLRRIIAKGKYLTPEHVERRRRLKLPLDELRIAATDLGDRIVVTNDYSHVVTAYARDFLVDAAAEAHRLYAKVDEVKHP
jgi:hypothetical protein